MERGMMDTIKNVLEPADEVIHNYEATDDGQIGRILLSHNKVLFVRQRGFFKKNYELTTDLAYDQIDQIKRVGDTLTLIRGEERHVFRSGYASRIEAEIKQIKESKNEA